MAAPTLKIKSQSRRARIVTVIVSFTGNPTSGTVSIPTAATPAGAVTVPPQPMVLNHFSKTAICKIEGVAYGSYGEPVVTLTNADGSASATGWAFTLFNGTQAPGAEPATFLPAFPVPAFNAPTVAVDAAVTSFFLQNLHTSPVTAPFTFAQPFHLGQLKPSDFLIGKVAGGPDVALQFNVKATHPDGSVRHATISGISPQIAASSTLTVTMVRSATGTSTAPATSASIATAGVTAVIDIVDNGVAYSASAAPVLSAGTAGDAWIGGAISTEYIVNIPLKDVNGVEHPHLTAQFGTRYYPGPNAYKVDAVIEHTKAYVGGPDVTYSGTIKIGGVTRYTITKTAATTDPLVQYFGTRWKKTFWHNNANPLHVRLNIPYLIGSKALPNYDQSVVMKEATLADYAVQLESGGFHPMLTGVFQRAMGTAGGRQDIGLAPSMYAATVLSMDKRAFDIMLASADAGGSWASHKRDTQGGPSNGLVLDPLYWPYASLIGTSTDGRNPATLQSEKLPVPGSNNPNTVDSSHQPAFAYIPYLITGDYYYLEELHFWNAYNMTVENPGYRGYGEALMHRKQLRGQAWSLRTLFEAAYITPNAHQRKAALNHWVDTNMALYNDNWTDSATSNKLGIIDNDLIYDAAGPNTGCGVFQEEHFTSSVGHGAELGFTESLRLLRWKAKFPIGRMTDPGVCWIDAATYELPVRSTEASPLYDTLAQCFQVLLSPAMYAAPCNSPERLAIYKSETGNVNTILGEMYKYADHPTSSNAAQMQPALALAVDSNAFAAGAEAWAKHASRSVKPDYGTSPQFAIVPRALVTTAPDPTPDPEPDPNPPTTGATTMTIADRVKDSTTTTGMGAFALAGAPEMNFKPFLTPPIVVGSVVPYAASHRTLNEWENGFGTLTAALTLVRTTVTSNSAGTTQPLNFSAGIKDVSCDLTAEFMKRFASVDSAATDVVIDPAAATFLIVEGGLAKNITVVNALQEAMGAAASQLAPAEELAGGDILTLVQNGVTVKTTLTAIAAAVATLNAPATTPGTGVTLAGPTSGPVSVQSTSFTVAIAPSGGAVSGTVVVTPSDNGGGGTFQPTTVSLTTAAPSATFKYTPTASAGARTISVTNNGSLTNPANITYTTSVVVSATVQNLWTGAPTTDGVLLSAKLNGDNSANSTRIAVSTSSDMSNPVFTPAVAPDATHRIAKHTITGKPSGAEFWYAVEVDGALDLATKGRFKTLPVGAANFKIVLGACANGASLPAINAINAINAITPRPHMAIFLGDVHYGADNNTLHNVAEQMVDMDNTLSTPARALLHREIPTLAIYDDHDFAGDNKTGRDASNAILPHRQGPIDFYRLRMPMPFASSVQTDPCHHSAELGRVRFIVSDLRADKTQESTADGPSKTMMGATQKAWFKAQIDAAKAAGQYVCWISTVPWYGGVSNSSNNWGGYNTERVELANYIKAAGMEGKISVIAGDAHSLGIHYGAASVATGNMIMPSFQVGPLGNNYSDKTGPLDQGPFGSTGEALNNFGIMDVIDDGTNMTIHWTGIDAKNGKEIAYWNFTPFGTYLADPSKTVPTGLVAPVATTGIMSAQINLVMPTSDGGAPVTGLTVRSYPAGGVDSGAGTLSLNRNMTGLTAGVSYRFDYIATNRIGASAPSPLSTAVTPAAETTPAGVFNATGGTVTEDATHKYWTFNATDTLNVTNEGPVEYVIVAGGGAGSSSSSGTTRAGGGGAGGFKTDAITLAVQTLTMTVGAGGVGSTSGAATAGGNSSIGSLVTVLGGGRGSASTPTTNPAGGSGGGGAGNTGLVVPGLGTVGQGHDGGVAYASATAAERAAGGGGGAGSVGGAASLSTGGNGGTGITIWGRSLAGGGGGSGAVNSGLGVDGGGNGHGNVTATAGAANTGGGGGGAAFGASSGGGGSGVIIIRRPL